MTALFDRLSPKKRREVSTLGNFVFIHCHENHTDEKSSFVIEDADLARTLENLQLCRECSRLLQHGIAKLSQCPYEPKPSCRKCPTHCYATGYREKVRKVMRFSGTYLIKHGRLDILWHYLK